MAYEVEDILLDDLARTDWISVRATNVCRNNRLNSLSDLLP
jgi:hypothetical protein